MMEQEKRQQTVELQGSKYVETSLGDHLGELTHMKMKEEQVSEETQTFPSAHSGYLGMPIKMEEEELGIPTGHEGFPQNEAAEDSFPGFPIVTIKMEEEEESQASDNQDCEQGFSGVIIKMEPEEEPWISDLQQRSTMFSRVQPVEEEQNFLKIHLWPLTHTVKGKGGFLILSAHRPEFTSYIHIQ
ncbi:uncharacterized protein LOC121921862 isoform X2 [Sceloporus undulatus]|uniref:uncharacterized protein LOC121921862 isoform X2 n=1 Tax=Sceloporus undulatus TaxID=8520 RepID=UPI001C4C520B|nr:uncharacterized protein LOC121921862 isoform X2 [Sceloporus undulatus]